MQFWLVLLVTLIVDQVSKVVIQRVLAEGESVPVIPNIFHLTYIRNPGAAFGVFAYQTTFFILMTVLVIMFILVAYRRVPSGRRLVKLSMALIVGGALGNLIDRMRYGLVVDFLDFRIWPVFNLADSAIVIGVSLLLLDIWRNDKKGQRKGLTDVR